MTGDAQTWVHQSAVGAAYEYLPLNRYFHSVGISAYTIFASNKNLSDIVFNETPTSYDVNIRQIAGGTEETGLIDMTFTPFSQTALSLSGGYSHVTYDTDYESEQSRSAIAYSAEVMQLFSPSTKAAIGIEASAASTDSMIQLSHILPADIEVALKGQYYNGQGPLPNNASLLLGFSYPAPKEYAKFFQCDSCFQQELKNWTSKPVVYATRVLVTTDEKVEHFVLLELPIANQTKAFGQTITPVAMADHFKTAGPSIAAAMASSRPSLGDPDAKITYTVFTSGVNPGQDYTNDLNMELKPEGKNNAILESKNNGTLPIPGNPALLGAHIVTITATLTRPDLSQPIVETASFTLTVTLGAAPVWAVAVLTPGNGVYGSPYTTTQSLSQYMADPSRSYTFTIDSQDTPGAFTIDASHHLVSTAIPAAAPTPYNITIRATDNITLGQASQPFTLTFAAGAPPVFDGAMTLLPATLYGNTSYANVLLTSYLVGGGPTNVNFSIVSQSAPGTLFVLSPDTKSLVFNLPKVPTTAPASYTVTVQATNLDTNGVSTPQALTLSITPGAPPAWTSSTLAPQGIYGQTYTSNSFVTLLSAAPGHSGNYSFSGAPPAPFSLINGNTQISSVPTPLLATSVSSPQFFTITACDLDNAPGAGSCAAPQVLSLTIDPGTTPPSFAATQIMPNATIGAAYGPSNSLTLRSSF